MNQNDPSESLINPVDCYLMPKEPFAEAQVGETSITLTDAQLEGPDGLATIAGHEMILINGAVQPDATFTIGGDIFTIGANAIVWIYQQSYHFYHQ